MKKTLVMAGMITAVGMMGCSKPQQAPESAALEAPVAEAAATPEIKSCKSTTDNEITADAWSDANNSFGLKLLAAKQGSAVVSPYSAERVLGMTLDGACGETANEMRTALSLPEAKNLSAAGTQVENTLLENTENIELSIDNRIWSGTALGDAYTSDIKSNYGIAPTSLDFAQDPEKARQTINADIAKSTKDRIKDLLPSGSITAATNVVLTNAVYFKAPWVKTFKAENTDKADFNGSEGKIQIDMMHHTAEHLAAETDSFVAFDMDFKDSNYSFMVVLPKEETVDALAKVEADLTAQSLREIRNQMSAFNVTLSMPKFRIDTTTPLTDILKSLGMNRAFSKDADFSAMAPNLYISTVIQKAFLEVSEEGAEAAAATAVVMMKRSLPPRLREMTITVDHPFLYAIVEQTTGTILFLGRTTTF